MNTEFLFSVVATFKRTVAYNACNFTSKLFKNFYFKFM
jgi:hypothetical protein